MEVSKKEKRLCLSCMEEHEIMETEIIEENIFNNEKVSFKAIYEYCPNTEEYLQSEEMIKSNDISFKDAYRKKKSLLTSSEIAGIREKYSVSQKDFSTILGWGLATITRYENHQVQDVAHDDILRKMSSDPDWFIELLKRAEPELSPKTFTKYYEQAKKLYGAKRNEYLIDSICTSYVDIQGDGSLTGCTELNLQKVVEVINLLALKVDSLHKVKLMKMLWYSDILNYKRTGASITGLAYRALPKGAVPLGYEQIVLLDGVNYEEIFYEEQVAYKFYCEKGFHTNALTAQEINVIEDVIRLFAKMNTDQLVNKMHEEDAYKYTNPYNIIPYQYANTLSID